MTDMEGCLVQHGGGEHDRHDHNVVNGPPGSCTPRALNVHARAKCTESESEQRVTILQNKLSGVLGPNVNQFPPRKRFYSFELMASWRESEHHN